MLSVKTEGAGYLFAISFRVAYEMGKSHVSLLSKLYPPVLLSVKKRKNFALQFVFILNNFPYTGND